MQIHEIATNTDYSIELKRTSGEEQMVCPKCSHLRKKKTVKCFSWNNDKSVGRCSHCESSFVLKSDYKAPEKKYALPKFNNRTELTQKVIDYFFKRAISQQTLIDFKITEGEEYMPQTEKKENTIQFNYFRNGVLINTKFRDGQKNFKLVKDAELILYNLDAIADSDEVLICEGEPDAMSWHEAGYKFVVSVPNGASKNQKLEWLDNCYQYFENKTKIYLSTDNDEPGLQLREELARRLGYDRCLKVYLDGHKDANEYLVEHNGQKLLDTLKTAKEYPIKGVFSINDVWEDVLDIYENGLPTGAKTGDRQFDQHLGCMPGELTMVTGIPGHGKSIYLDQISIGLCIHSEWRFGVCSPESHPMSFYFTRLVKRLLGKKFSKANIDLRELQQSRDWIKDRYHLIKPEEGYTLDSILDSARILVVRKGIKGLILDPWNRIENTKPSGMSDGEWIVSCLVKIIDFAQKTGVHVFLVAHPTKMPKTADGSNFLVPNLYSISGSAHFFNMTQNGFTIFRNMVTEMTEVHFQKIKWEHLGETGMAEYIYHKDNARFYEPGDDPTINWLTSQKELLPKERSAIQPSLQFDSEYINEQFDECPF
jgi:twinkle protein